MGGSLDMVGSLGGVTYFVGRSESRISSIKGEAFWYCNKLFGRGGFFKFQNKPSDVKYRVFYLKL